MAILSFMDIRKFLQRANVFRWTGDSWFSSENKEHVNVSWANLKHVFCLSSLQHKEDVRCSGHTWRILSPCLLYNIRKMYEGSPKRYRFFFKFIAVLTTWSDISPSKYSPLLLIHRSQRFFQFWNASWNVFCGMARRSCSAFSFISSTVWNRRPFRVDFNFGNKKKSAWAKFGE